MKLRTYKRILFFLKDLNGVLDIQGKPSVAIELISFFTDSELRLMLHWLYKDIWSKNALGFMERSELIKLIESDEQLLLWTIYSLEQAMIHTPTYSQKEVTLFFERTQNQNHYLAFKTVDDWDEYDTSNYKSLLIKTGTTKRVYGIFTADVLAEDVYAVSTKPSFLFDTEKEAEQEIEQIILERKFSRDELTIHSLWLMQ